MTEEGTISDFSRTLTIEAAQVVTPSGTKQARITIVDGKIHDIRPTQGPASQSPEALSYMQDTLVLPGFLDLHVHGGGGWRIGLNNKGDENPVAKVSQYLATTGTTSFLPTIATTSDEALRETVTTVAGLVDTDTAGALVLGSHVEGPYLSPEKKGAMQQQFFIDASMDHFREFWDASEGTIRYMTVAPERIKSWGFVREVKALGVVVSAGHTNAYAADMRIAFDHGINVVTHLFNAMRGIHHREPGVAGAALANPEIWVELIGDGIHVDPTVMQIVLRSKGVHKVAVITDGGSFMGQPDGTYKEGHRDVTVCDKKVSLPDGTLAGSASPMNVNCLVLRNEVGLSWSDIARVTSLNPAKILGLEHRKGSLEVGKDADIVVMKTNGEVLLTLVQGRIVYQKEDVPVHAGTQNI